MAAVFVKLFGPDSDYARPMVHITIEPESNADVNDDALLAFQTKHGFGFVMRAEDAIELAATIRRLTHAS